MNKIRSVILYIILIGLFLLGISAVRPYWNRSMIKMDLETTAVYGTKHSSDDTFKFFREKLQDRGYDSNPENFNFHKDRNNTVSIKWIYQDEIRFFGFALKKLEFTLKVTKRETKEIL